MKIRNTLIREALFLCVFGMLAANFNFSTENGRGTGLQKQWYSGYEKEIKGETLIYHSPLPEAGSSLLVRSVDKNRFIEWATEPVPMNNAQDEVTFVWIAGIDVNTDSHTFDFFINGKKHLSFSNPLNRKKRHWRFQGQNSVELEFKVTEIDRHGDFMGYMFLTVPPSLYPPNRPLHLRVQGETAGSRSWFMVFKHRVEPKLTLFCEQAILRSPAQSSQSIRAEIIHLGEPVAAAVLTKDQRIDTKFQLGLNVIRLAVPSVSQPETKTVQVEVGSRPLHQADIVLRPVRHKDIYLLHHSHVDIGYTHVQEEVEKIQARNIQQAIELAGQTQQYPKGSQFKWNTEVMWPVDSYLKTASLQDRESLASAIRMGWIGLDALYANELTGLCRPEELMQLLERARSASRTYGVNIEAAMITDIPGYSWGLVPALAQSGIKYLSIGTNSGHRIGHILSEWADRPFYWVSSSGQEKVLCWVHGKGYSWFHGGLDYSELKTRLQETPILDYLSKLNAADYPYDIIGIRYNIGSDNGPPDPELADTVRAWNEKYKSPRLIIATTSELFKAFENRYKSEIPAVSGDFTGCWEDGAASSARETTLNRQAAERLVQAGIVWTLRAPQSYPWDMFDQAWQNVLLFDEHTWGSWNSISDPESDFTLQQWTTKQSFALEADRLSRTLLEEACAFKGAHLNVESLDVLNTSSWKRTDLVFIPKGTVLTGDSVKDSQGRPLNSQRLSTGELAVLVEDVPPFGAKRIFFTEKPSGAAGKAKAWAGGISNGQITVQIDASTGAIRSLKIAGLSEDLVDGTDGLGLNDYLYVAGRNPEKPQRSGRVTVRVKEQGPLVASLMIVSEAPGCRNLKREIRLVDSLARVDIINEIDKENIFDPEGVHFAFPFFIPEGIMRLDAGWGFFRPESGQLPGSNKNYFSVQRWVDISNQTYGITWANPDAPLIEVGGIAADPVAVGWKKIVQPSQTVYSYVMNNYWETNYKASQEGLAVFRYSLRPHRLFNPAEAERFGRENSQPLIVAPVLETSSKASLLKVNPESVIITSMKPSRDGSAILLRLFNAGGAPEDVSLIWESSRPEHVYLSSPFEEKGKEIRGALFLPACGLITLRAEFKLDHM